MNAPSQPSRRRAISQQLESFYAAGVRQLRRVADAVTADTPPADEKGSDMDRATSSDSLFEENPVKTSLDAADRPQTLRILSEEVARCTRCGELAAARTQTVFGVGNPNARLAFFGEAPGADEDRQGEPFVGRAGQLLDKIIAACTMQREDVYILNTIKCRPPGNRNPNADEIDNCRGFWQRQLEIIAPEFICCLGSVAAQTLLETTQTIGRLRGRFHDWRGAKVIATYHPAYLLRNPSAKRQVWDDMQLLMKEMGIELPQK